MCLFMACKLTACLAAPADPDRTVFHHDDRVVVPRSDAVCAPPARQRHTEGFEHTPQRR